MGYYTNYTLEIDSEDNTIISDFLESCDGAKWSLYSDGKCRDSSKWYEALDDTKVFSLKHPTVLFTLSGEGEEPTDIWKLYVRNGKAQLEEAVFTIAPFDETKLA